MKVHEQGEEGEIIARYFESPGAVARPKPKKVHVGEVETHSKRVEPLLKG